jgi:sterol desaturase/sphingolipid hydroxylase (fatty acid hydroxylase superfamily)
MNPIVYAIPVFLLTIALEWGAARLLKRDVYDLADAISSLQFGVLSQLAGAATKLVSLGVYVLAFGAAHLGVWSTASIPLWVMALLIYDFFYYWNHRLDHEVAVLWAGHVVHHSGERYNLTTALRQSATSGLTGWIFYLPMAVLGVPPLMFAVVALIDLLYQYWVHTELVGRLGILDRILVTPSNHRVHHGQNDYCIDRNYGGILIIWDILFGTFAEERPRELIAFGVRKPLASYNPFWGNVHVYVDLIATARRARGIGAKARVFLGAPGGGAPGGGAPGGGAPGGGAPGGAQAAAAAPFDPSAFRPYRPQISPATLSYALLHYLGLTAGLILFLVHYDGFAAPGALALAILLGATLFAQAALLEGAPYALPLEAARLVLIILAAAAPVFPPGEVGPGVRGAAAALAIGSLLVLPFLRRGGTRAFSSAHQI